MHKKSSMAYNDLYKNGRRGMLQIILCFLKLFSSLYIGTGQISTAKSFPRVLSEEEEAKYIRDYYENGDRFARNKLIEHNLRLAAHIAKKYTRQGDDSEDIISIGIVGLIKAIDTFDYKKNRRIASYASRCISNEILMYIRSDKKNRLNISLSDVIGSDKEGDEMTLEDVIESQEAAPYKLMEEESRIKFLRQEALPLLRGREAEIISLRYGVDGDKVMTQNTVAEKLGISRSYVSRIEKRAIDKLRKKFGDME